MISREPTIERLAVARSLLLEPFGLDEAKLAAGARDDRDAPHRRRRPLLPVHAQRGLEPRGRHRQERQLRHRPGRRRARRRRREDRVRLFRRHLRGGAARRGAHGADDRGGRPEPARQGRHARRRSRPAASSTRRWIRSRRSTARRRSRCSRRSSSSRAGRIRASSRSWPAWRASTTSSSSRAPTARIAADVRPLVRLSLTVIAEQTIAGVVRRESGNGGGGGRFGLGYFQDDVIEEYVERRRQRRAHQPRVAPAPRPG